MLIFTRTCSPAYVRSCSFICFFFASVDTRVVSSQGLLCLVPVPQVPSGICFVGTAVVVPNYCMYIVDLQRCSWGRKAALKLRPAQRPCHALLPIWPCQEGGVFYSKCHFPDICSSTSLVTYRKVITLVLLLLLSGQIDCCCHEFNLFMGKTKPFDVRGCFCSSCSESRKHHVIDHPPSFFRVKTGWSKCRWPNEPLTLSPFHLRLQHRRARFAGVDVPEDCWMRVGEEKRTWENGKALVLDTSFEHETRNNSRRDRIVLIIDYWHPGNVVCPVTSFFFR